MSLAKNFLYNILYQVTLLIIPLITMPYISRTLGSNGVGIYAFTNSIVQWFILFGVLGVSLYGQREIAYVRDNKRKINKKFWSIFIGKLVTVSIALILYIAFVFFYGKEYLLVYFIQTIYLISAALDISWFFMGLEDFKKTVTRSIIIKLISIVLLFLFIKTSTDLWKYVLILAFSEVFGQLILWFSISKHIGKLYVNVSEIKKNIFNSINIFIPQIAIQVYVIMDKTMLGIYSNTSEVGYYDMAQKIVRICLAVITSLGTVMLPRISNEFSKGDIQKIKYYIFRSIKFATYIAVPMMFGLIGISNKFVPWFFGDQFIKTAQLIMVNSPVLLFIGWNNAIGIQMMLPMGKEKEFTIAVTGGAILNFILNLNLIPKYHGLGTSIASVLAELFILVIEFYQMKSLLPFKRIFSESFKYWIASVAMFLIIIFIGEYIHFKKLYIVTMLQITVGIIFYFTVLIILKCEFTIMLINKIMKYIERAKLKLM